MVRRLRLLVHRLVRRRAPRTPHPRRIAGTLCSTDCVRPNEA